jgi:hypothetical protein
MTFNIPMRNAGGWLAIFALYLLLRSVISSLLRPRLLIEPQANGDT